MKAKLALAGLVAAVFATACCWPAFLAGELAQWGKGN